MKINNISATLLVGLFVHGVSAQTSPTPPSATPAAPVTTPTPPPPATAASAAGVAEGTLFNSQRSISDKGKFEWVCTYRVANLKRSVLLDESCPATMMFELRR
ncbi:MAG: hypothetical protein IPP88_06735 [Betaproteobacteria bacterium]|nr:hypothetical protein [Betaproteobacteria bacterium]